MLSVFHKKLKSQIEQQGSTLPSIVLILLYILVIFFCLNRILAGLSHATIVVATEKKGGAMVTGQLAFNYNRAVFAVPGSPNYPTQLGCNHLIKKVLRNCLTSPLIFSPQWDGRPKIERKILKHNFVFISTMTKSYSNIRSNSHTLT